MLPRRRKSRPKPSAPSALLANMKLTSITVKNLGSLCFYEAVFTPGLNIIKNRSTPELAAAVGFLLGNRQTVAPEWVCAHTDITAGIVLDGVAYTVRATPCRGQLQLAATDPAGIDVTETYLYALSHCPDAECFDGLDHTLPFRLCRYRNPADYTLPPKQNCHTDTQTFRAYLLRYIKAFVPEPINSKKPYQIALDRQGNFYPFHPGFSGRIFLSATEEKLYLYLCFLNLAEFWAGFEKLRNLHYEKKPLLIQNFLEFLDESADISRLLARTRSLQRQILIFTP